MFVAELCFVGAGTADTDVISHKVNGLLGALRMNGQVCGRAWPIFVRSQDVVTIVDIPDQDALHSTHANQYVRDSLADLRAIGGHEPVITILAQDVDGSPPCACAARSSLILYTNYLTLEAPLRCGDCFGPVPLYNVPHTQGDDYYDIIVWQSDYQACDSLQMNCTTLERATIRQMSRLDSSLSQQGIEICTKLRETVGIPVYYRLYSYGARSKKRERARLCPGCGAAWFCDNPWHMFDFRCDHCCLVSNIA